MARYKNKTETSEASIRDFAKTLRLLADSYEAQADFMRQCNLPTVEVTHWKTARAGVSGLAAFAGAIQSCIAETTLIAGIDAMIETPVSVKASQSAARDKLSDKPKKNPKS